MYKLIRTNNNDLNDHYTYSFALEQFNSVLDDILLQMQQWSTNSK